MQPLTSRTAAPPRRQGPAICLASVMLAVLAAGCQAQSTVQAAPQSPPSAAVLMQRIEAEVGEARCSSTADCRSLPIGHKACGGPAGWMAWSIKASDGVRLQALAQELAERQRQQQMAEGRMSTCNVVPDPGAHCDAGRCVLVRGNPTR